MVTSHGPDDLVHVNQTVHRMRELTNLSSGKSITNVSDLVDHDLEVIDNGDGTLTYVILPSGAAAGTDPTVGCSSSTTVRSALRG